MAAVLLEAIRDAGNDIPTVTVTPTSPFDDAGGIGQVETQEEKSILDNTAIPETEKQQIVLARCGQGRFRAAIRDRTCRVTGLADEAFLIASHIKPWRYASNNERLDGENGLLLAPQVDLLFDRGFMSFADDGAIVTSPVLPRHVLDALRIDPATVGRRPLSLRQREYMAYHRERILLQIADKS